MSKKKILIIEDEEQIRNLWQRIVGNLEDYTIITAETCSEGLRLVQESLGDIAVIVTDMNTGGGIDGVDMAFGVRTADPTIPIVLCCSDKNNRLTEEHRLLFVEILEKPASPVSVLNAVTAAIEGKA